GIALDANGLVYIIDTAHQRIRAVDAFGQISTWLSASTATCNSADTLYQLQPASQITFDSTGGAYISGYSCGAATGNSYALGLMFRSSTGVISRILGNNVVNTAENQLATSTSLPDLGGFAIDSAGNIAISIYSNQRVRLITKSTGKINTIVGNGVGGYNTAADAFTPPGDYEPALGVEVNYPLAVAYAPGNHLVICDTNNFAVREIW
ncbi:MAG TPA: hypothetical protein VK745_33030, partial [Polyangiaceae bacterium]|nr:hypothetical protein [Polyangiaceae bacterium]